VLWAEQDGEAGAAEARVHVVVRPGRWRLAELDEPLVCALVAPIWDSKDDPGAAFATWANVGGFPRGMQDPAPRAGFGGKHASRHLPGC
jgi:uncharacterized protein YbjT (DUF2867 family)